MDLRSGGDSLVMGDLFLGVGTTKTGRFFSLAMCLFQISMTLDGLNYMATTYVVFFGMS